MVEMKTSVHLRVSVDRRLCWYFGCDEDNCSLMRGVRLGKKPISEDF